jgi:hypothetical protein
MIMPPRVFPLPVGARQERSASGLAEAPAALMGPLLGVFGDARIKVGLQLIDAPTCRRYRAQFALAPPETSRNTVPLGPLEAQ